ncbi:rhodanese-like domain-containing protein [Bacillus marinisedimentorum]|uniref:rhodanese-like domain-containing protein n=1 Tax=Bacillus marinisedimentorum TaxID=1821260 RepID=UPI00087330F9|nr:rhodanese-like domain-containing protein [Bacillus marinisedimentorum]
MKKAGMGILVLLLLAVLGACGSGATYQDVSPEKAQALIQEEDVQVLDVRTSQEFAEGHIPGAMLIPLQELEGRLGELDKEGKYVVVCRSGNRSAQASEILAENGFTNIHNMNGGMSQWTGDVKF